MELSKTNGIGPRPKGQERCADGGTGGRQWDSFSPVVPRWNAPTDGWVLPDVQYRTNHVSGFSGDFSGGASIGSPLRNAGEAIPRKQLLHGTLLRMLYQDLEQTQQSTRKHLVVRAYTDYTCTCTDYVSLDWQCNSQAVASNSSQLGMIRIMISSGFVDFGNCNMFEC